ncbi:hypothetical protein RND71_001300 [Anisodus tanguticus]|uniref:Uncharacterized protein n=1 Tax=Anisodus tanguticus TaxID=243964 RepID=A0AAE1SXM3_9SOLA|nr:hypothetical protein RND71_001300 [Anisodus tanguticus]
MAMAPTFHWNYVPHTITYPRHWVNPQAYPPYPNSNNFVDLPMYLPYQSPIVWIHQDWNLNAPYPSLYLMTNMKAHPTIPTSSVLKLHDQQPSKSRRPKTSLRGICGVQHCWKQRTSSLSSYIKPIPCLCLQVR